MYERIESGFANVGIPFQVASVVEPTVRIASRLSTGLEIVQQWIGPGVPNVGIALQIEQAVEYGMGAHPGAAADVEEMLEWIGADL